MFRERTDKGESSEEDPDYQLVEKYRVMEHVEYNFPISSSTTVGQIKQMISEKHGKIGQEKVKVENLELCKCKYGEIFE
jgi:hypothetical protein